MGTKMRRLSVAQALFVAVAVVAFPARSGLAQDFTLTADLPSGQPVGTTVTWTIGGGVTENIEYRLSISRDGGSSRIRYDFSPDNELEWTPISEGTFTARATVRDRDAGMITTVTEPFTVVPIAVAGPVVSATSNPLVALYSGPACAPALFMRVAFREAQAGARTYRTDARPCDANRTLNFYVAGMREDTNHLLRHELVNAAGDLFGQGPTRQFMTGLATITPPLTNVLVPPGPSVSFRESVVLYSALGSTNALATNLAGELIWYYEPPDDDVGPLLTRPVEGGTMLVHGNLGGLDRRRLREIDLAGNTVREVTTERLSEQVRAMGGPTLSAIHHEARRLPDGKTVLIGAVEKILEDVQGPGPVDVVGDYIIALDENLQVVWTWDAFDHLDPARAALLGEVCMTGDGGCTPVFLDTQANDWMHSNALGYSTADGNLILSIRHQDWVIKIDYQDGAGTGAILWALGNEGDFAISSGNPNDWFSHQHDSNFVAPNSVILYDNGNGTLSCVANPDDCASRGQHYVLDENAMTATLVLNADLQNFSGALGSAQMLSNGNSHFNSGIQDGTPAFATADETTPDGTIVYSQFLESRVYRSFRLRDLYTPPPL